MIRRSHTLLLALLLGVAMAHPLRAEEYGGGFVPGKSPSAAASNGMGAVTIIGVLALGGAGAWMLLRGRKINFQGRTVRKLAIDETKSLGSRQYLVVASYEGKKMLLGVCPGRIDLLTHLDGSTAEEKRP